MRHSSLDLTMNLYTDPGLLDVAGAQEALPELPLEDVAQDDAGMLSRMLLTFLKASPSSAYMSSDRRRIRSKRN